MGSRKIPLFEMSMPFLGLADPPITLLIVVFVLALIGLVAIGAVIFLTIDEHRLGRDYDRIAFEHGPVDRGAAIPDFVNEETLRGLATHHQLDAPPMQIEKSRRFKLGINPLHWFKGSAEKGTKETHKPHQDMGELIRRVLRHLDDHDELNQVDQVFVGDLMFDSIPSFGDPGHAREVFNSWLDDNYPDGLDGVAHGELAAKLATIGTEIPQRAVKDRLKAAFDNVKSEEAVLFLEGEWNVDGQDGDLLLKRTDIRVIGDQFSSVPRSIPLPDDASITVRLEGDLTKHGKNRIVGIARPIRASVVATVRQCDPGECSLDLTPIAVFQRVGST